MKTIALVMAYNEERYIYKCLENIYPLVDEVVLFEGTVSPFEDQSAHSQDNTISEIERFIKDNGNKKIAFGCTWCPEKNSLMKKREDYEGWIKNEMLSKSSIEHGDLIWMVDADEFYVQECANDIIGRFKLYDDLESLVVEEYQHAYKVGLCFNASHQGRFMRYKKGAKYTASQHFFYPDDFRDISRIGQVWPRRLTGFHHLCWAKRPELIRQKVLTFKRPSFTAWYNHCYLMYPFNANGAYHNNQALSQKHGWPGTGFAEGQTEKLYEFDGELPEVIKDLNDDWREYIRQNAEHLLIKE